MSEQNSIKPIWIRFTDNGSPQKFYERRKENLKRTLEKRVDFKLHKNQNDIELICNQNNLVRLVILFRLILQT